MLIGLIIFRARLNCRPPIVRWARRARLLGVLAEWSRISFRPPLALALCFDTVCRSRRQGSGDGRTLLRACCTSLWEPPSHARAARTRCPFSPGVDEDRRSPTGSSDGMRRISECTRTRSNAVWVLPGSLGNLAALDLLHWKETSSIYWGESFFFIN